MPKIHGTLHLDLRTHTHTDKCFLVRNLIMQNFRGGCFRGLTLG